MKLLLMNPMPKPERNEPVPSQGRPLAGSSTAIIRQAGDQHDAAPSWRWSGRRSASSGRLVKMAATDQLTDIAMRAVAATKAAPPHDALDVGRQGRR